MSRRSCSTGTRAWPKVEVARSLGVDAKTVRRYGLALQRQPLGRVVQRLGLTAGAQRQHAAADQAGQVHGRPRPGHVGRAEAGRDQLDVDDAVGDCPPVTLPLLTGPLLTGRC